MKVKILCVLCVAAVAGCVQVPDYAQMTNDSLSHSLTFNPMISADGVRSFRAVGHNIVPSYAGADYSYEKTHLLLLSSEMGKRQYCVNGYTVAKAAEQPTPAMTIYDGVCRP